MNEDNEEKATGESNNHGRLTIGSALVAMLNELGERLSRSSFGSYEDGNAQDWLGERMDKFDSGEDFSDEDIAFVVGAIEMSLSMAGAIEQMLAAHSKAVEEGKITADNDILSGDLDLSDE